MTLNTETEKYQASAIGVLEGLKHEGVPISFTRAKGPPPVPQFILRCVLAEAGGQDIGEQLMFRTVLMVGYCR